MRSRIPLFVAVVCLCLAATVLASLLWGVWP
jgi:hypothetical protein